MNAIEQADSVVELVAAVDELAKVGQVDRSEVAKHLAAAVRKRARFEALRLRLDPRFGDALSRERQN